ncbi:M16 family metallopeptidase [Rubrivirga sp. IMCC45206]|uniref:M16 family metallopeptidase n=1 Tax=Rubrivirga sp. IMCC45206 TaxID=3391614 RepID=UPI003990229D
MRSGLLLTAALAVLLAPAAGAQSLLGAFEPSVTEFTLDNGMTFIIVERHEAPVVSFYTIADVGSVDEPIGQTGISHMFEHMAFKGTTRIGTTDLAGELAALEAEEAAYTAFRTARLGGASDAEVERLEAAFVAARDAAKAFATDNEFDQIISRQGAVGLNATTNFDKTDYFYSLPSNRAELWFALEADRFLNPVLREFYQERDVVQEERRLRTESNPIGRLIEEFFTIAFKAHPYGRPVVGHMADLESISRTEAEAFYATYYVPNNLVSVLVGDIDPAQARVWAERYFGPIPAGEAPPPVRTVEPEQLGERRVTIEDPAQPIVLVGFQRPAQTDPSDPVYTVLADVLGRGRTSRLYRALVETELAVAGQALAAPFGGKYATQFLTVGVPAGDTDVAEVEAALLDVLADVAENGITEEELARAKNRARADLVGGLESNTGLAVQLGVAETLTGDWRSLFEQLDAISAVTAADVQRVAAETFTMRNRTVAVSRRPADS